MTNLATCRWQLDGWIQPIHHGLAFGVQVTVSFRFFPLFFLCMPGKKIESFHIYISQSLVRINHSSPKLEITVAINHGFRP